MDLIKKIDELKPQLEVLNERTKKSFVVKMLYDDIKKMLNEGYTYQQIVEILKDAGIEYNLSSFIRAIRNLDKEKQKGDKMKKTKVVALVNFKGGVGKSTVANVLDFENSIVLNIDTQNAAEINAGDRTIDYFEMMDEYDISNAKEAVELLKEEGFDTIFIDTPGAITREFEDILPLVDYFIIVTNPNIRDISHTLNTIFDLANKEKIKKDVKFIFIHNKWHNNEELEQLKELERIAKEELGSKLIGSSQLKYSRAIPTMEKMQKNIEELSVSNKIAYRSAKKWISELKKDIRELLEK